MVTLTKTFTRKYLKFYLVLGNLIKEWGLIQAMDHYSSRQESSPHSFSLYLLTELMFSTKKKEAKKKFCNINIFLYVC